ncbi:MAG: pyridoxine 5'-phosphate synthase, partial [Thermodesulfobacteriota bacterium]
LRETVRTKLNLEMASTDEMAAIAREIKPDMVTLVPEKRKELTTEGGLDVAGNSKAVSRTVKSLGSAGIFVSLFIDPDAEQIKAAKSTGAEMVEIHTGAYAEAADESAREGELSKIKKAVKKASGLGMRISAGHGLNYVNAGPVALIKGIEEFNIGHSIVSRALMVGFENAVREMVRVIG